MALELFKQFVMSGWWDTMNHARNIKSAQEHGGAPASQVWDVSKRSRGEPVL